MKLDPVAIVDWLARIGLFATAARIGLHWAKPGLTIWIGSESYFWNFYSKIEETLSWLSGSLQKYGSKRRVAGEAIKSLIEDTKDSQEIDVTIETKDKDVSDRIRNDN